MTSISRALAELWCHKNSIKSLSHVPKKKVWSFSVIATGLLTRTKTQVRGGAVKKPGGFQPDLVGNWKKGETEDLDSPLRSAWPPGWTERLPRRSRVSRSTQRLGSSPMETAPALLLSISFRWFLGSNKDVFSRMTMLVGTNENNPLVWNLFNFPPLV